MPDLALSPAEQAGREQRQFPRYLTLATARILAGDPIDCAVLNISKGGACLLVTDPTAVPRTFELVVDPGRLRIHCNLAWRSRHRIGVAFVDSGAETSAVPSVWPAILSSEDA
jgi:hypothetical protein